MLIIVNIILNLILIL